MTQALNELDSELTELYMHQMQYNAVFRKYIAGVGKLDVRPETWDELVFLPISFFKTHEVKTGEWTSEQVFRSSATTGMERSEHHFKNLTTYRMRARSNFEAQFGPLADYCFLFLLPSYIGRSDASLLFMCNDFMEQSAHTQSGFYLDDLASLHHSLLELKEANQKTILWGVSFALLDFCAQYQLEFEELTIMDTGGMKGRRKEMIRTDLYAHFRKSFPISTIASEYGMTELSNQAYAMEDGKFKMHKHFQVQAHDAYDILSPLPLGKTGRLHIVDRSNEDSCAFVATEDLGAIAADGTFTVIGRMDQSAIRGCNLLYS